MVPAAVSRSIVVSGSILGASIAGLAILAACSTAPRPKAGVGVSPSAVGSAASAASATAAPGAAASPAPGAAPGDALGEGRLAAAPIVRGRSRWLPVRWRDLPGWDSDRSAELWPALQRGCERPPAPWAELCARARLDAASASSSDASARAWLEARLQPYRVESTEGVADGLITGYFEPLVEASRMPKKGFRVPLYAPPADLGARRPYWTRQQIDSSPAAQPSLRGREIAWLKDPLDALVLQIQGSGRLQITEADGSRHLVRVAYAAHNDQPYRSVGRWLVERGELRLDEASWPSIRGWAALHPARVNELLWSNPRYVFFREEALPDPAVGPKGAQAVPLTPGRSIAVDPQSIPFGTIAWLDTTEPLSSRPLRRAVVAQDTGSAIVGAVRADYFWGWGAEAETQAGRMKQPLRLWVLWPKSALPAP